MSSTGYISGGRYIPGEPPSSLKKHREHSGHRTFVRADMAATYKKDLVQPRIGNKPNPEFIAAFPEKAHMYFSEEEINEAKREL